MIKKNLILLLFFLPFFILLSWYRQGLFIATGESAIPFYNVFHALINLGTPWNEGALGYPNGINSSLIFYFFAWKLSNFIPNFQIQYLFFFILLLIPILGLIILDRALKLGRVSVITSVLFYTLNLTTIIGVWGRMQYPFIFFYAILPLAYIIFLNGLDRYYIQNIIFTNLILLICSITFASLPMIELFWILLFTYILFYSMLFINDKKKLLLGWLYFSITFISWIIVNTWWLFPYLATLTTTNYITNQAYSVNSDIGTLTSLSEKLGNLSFVFRLMHRDMFINIQNVWGNLYFSPFFIILSYIIPILAFFPLLIKEKNKYIYYFLGVSLTLLFLIKGSRGPFGFLFLFLFSHIRFLEAFRNPFEKFILALPFFYAPLIGYSVNALYKFMKIKYGNLLARATLILGYSLIFGLLVFPIWNKWVFSSNISPGDNLNIGYYVKVPDYYQQANNWLNKDSTDFRNVALPMSGEGITYEWQYGYSGVELSNTLFDKPFVSLSTTIQFLDLIANQLEYTFVKYPEYFSRVMSMLDAKYVMLRSDVDFKGRNMKNPQYFLDMLSSSADTYPGLVYDKSFDKLVFYKNTSDISKIYATNGGLFAPDTIPYGDILSQTDFQKHDAIFNPNTNPAINNFLISNSQKIFVSSENTINSGFLSGLTLQEAFKNIPYTRIAPGTLLFPLIKITENLSIINEKDANKQISLVVDITEKRLGDLQKGIDSREYLKSKNAAEEYLNSLTALNKYIHAGNEGIFLASKEYLGRKLLLERLLLNDLETKTKYQEVTKLLKHNQAILEALLKQYDIIPQNQPLLPTALWIDYQFSAPDNGQYTINIQNDNLNNYYKIEDFNQIQLNNTVVTVQPNLTDKWISLGEYNLHKGENEIFIYTPDAKNLISSITSTSGELSTKGMQQALPITNFDPFSSYNLHLEYNISGNGCLLTDFKTDIGVLLNENLGCGNTLHGWQVRNLNFFSSSAPTIATLQLVLKDLDGRTNIAYKNIQVTRNFSNNVLLSKINSITPRENVPTLFYKRINPSKYIVHVHNAKKPFFLIFSESFHPLWKASFSNGKNIPENMHVLVNSFANAWYVEQTGSYDVTLTFSAEDYYNLGKKTSIIGGLVIIMAIIGFIFYNKRRKKYGNH